MRSMCLWLAFHTPRDNHRDARCSTIEATKSTDAFRTERIGFVLARSGFPAVHRVLGWNVSPR